MLLNVKETEMRCFCALGLAATLACVTSICLAEDGKVDTKAVVAEANKQIAAKVSPARASMYATFVKNVMKEVPVTEYDQRQKEIVVRSFCKLVEKWEPLSNGATDAEVATMLEQYRTQHLSDLRAITPEMLAVDRSSLPDWIKEKDQTLTKAALEWVADRPLMILDAKMIAQIRQKAEKGDVDVAARKAVRNYIENAVHGRVTDIADRSSLIFGLARSPKLSADCRTKEFEEELTSRVCVGDVLVVGDPFVRSEIEKACEAILYVPERSSTHPAAASSPTSEVRNDPSWCSGAYRRLLKSGVQPIVVGNVPDDVVSGTRFGMPGMPKAPARPMAKEPIIGVTHQEFVSSLGAWYNGIVYLAHVTDPFEEQYIWDVFKEWEPKIQEMSEFKGLLAVLCG
jgi:hypothetical protein